MRTGVAKNPGLNNSGLLFPEAFRKIRSSPARRQGTDGMTLDQVPTEHRPPKELFSHRRLWVYLISVRHDMILLFMSLSAL
jgi:hypothetical protein